MYAKLVFVLCLCLVEGYPNGAPKSSCTSMKPSHGVSAQTDPSPYQLIVDTQTIHSVPLASSRESEPENVTGGSVQKREVSSSNSSLLVTLKSDNGTEFHGFLIQARSGSDIVGKFSIPSGGKGKLLDCNQGSHNAATHNKKETKQSVQFLWEPMPGFSGTVVFKATVVKDKRRFWMGIESPAVQVING